MNNSAKLLYRAAEAGDVETVKELLVDALPQDINNRSTNTDKFTPLIIAAKKGYTEIVDVLLRDGRADVNIKNRHGSTALTWASWNIYSETVEALLKCPNIDVNMQDGDNWSALIHACENGQTDSVKSLLKHPAIQVNAFGITDTALMIACRADRKFTKTVEALLGHSDIDVNIRNPTTGHTALMYATFKDYSRTVSALLKDKNIDVNMRRRENYMTALMIASERACLKSMRELLAHPNINVYLKSKRGETAYDMATNEHTRNLLRQHMDANPAPVPAIPEQAVRNTDSGAESPRRSDQEDGRTEDGPETENEEDIQLTPRKASSTWSLVHRLADPPSLDRLPDAAGLSAGVSRAARAAGNSACADATRTPSEGIRIAPITPYTPSALLNGWLSKRLLDDADNPFPIELIHLCEEKLVLQEGFACEQDFAQLPEEEFTGEYLSSIGIVRKGLHIRLRRLHHDLRTEYLQKMR